MNKETIRLSIIQQLLSQNYDEVDVEKILEQARILCEYIEEGQQQIAAIIPF